jgi:hypothetical protein
MFAKKLVVFNYIKHITYNHLVINMFIFSGFLAFLVRFYYDDRIHCIFNYSLSIVYMHSKQNIFFSN